MAETAQPVSGTIMGARPCVDLVIGIIRDKRPGINFPQLHVDLMLANNPALLRFAGRTFDHEAVTAFAESVASKLTPAMGICAICEELYYQINSLLEEPEIPWATPVLHGNSRGCVWSDPFDLT